MYFPCEVLSYSENSWHQCQKHGPLPENDTIDSERRIIFVTKSPRQATRQGTRSRTLARGLGLFRGRALELCNTQPMQGLSIHQKQEGNWRDRRTEGTVLLCWGHVGVKVGSETYFLWCQRAEESHTPQIHSAWSILCPHSPLVARVRNRQGEKRAPFQHYKRHESQARCAHLPPWSTRHTWDGWGDTLHRTWRFHWCTD